MQFGQIPADIKGCQHFMKLAEDHDDRNVIISYYARMAAIQLAMRILPGAKPPEVSKYLMSIMDWLETAKQQHAAVEGINNETVAQALIEEYMLKLYDYAYKCDCEATFQKNMVKSYYTASLLCEVLTQFGTLSEDIIEKSKISKYRAAYIHNMLKHSHEPTPINVTIIHDDEEEKTLSLTEDQVNKRRELRGEEPLTPPGLNLSPEELALRQRTLDEFSNKTKEDAEEDLKKMKETIDNMPMETIQRNRPITPDRIIDVGPPFVDLHPAEENSELQVVAVLQPDQTERAIKYCKWASSSLNYDDVKSAVVNLEKALHLCRYGAELE